MSDKPPTDDPGAAAPDDDFTRQALQKLPALGPVAWLYAQTQDKRYLFLADLEWAVVPPIALDQCRLFMHEDLPQAFVTWAYVNDAAHQRLLKGQSKLAPDEWNAGPHLWLIDVVAPFGDIDAVLDEIQRLDHPGVPLRYLRLDPLTQRRAPHVHRGAEPNSPETGVVPSVVH